MCLLSDWSGRLWVPLLLHQAVRFFLIPASFSLIHPITAQPPCALLQSHADISASQSYLGNKPGFSCLFGVLFASAFFFAPSSSPWIVRNLPNKADDVFKTKKTQKNRKQRLDKVKKIMLGMEMCREYLVWSDCWSKTKILKKRDMKNTNFGK